MSWKSVLGSALATILLASLPLGTIGCAPSGGSTAAKAQPPPTSFAAQPAPGTRATCPVMKHAFTVTDKTVFSVYNGRHYGYCCPGCKAKFDANPTQYTSP